MQRSSLTAALHLGLSSPSIMSRYCFLIGLSRESRGEEGGVFYRIRSNYKSGRRLSSHMQRNMASPSRAALAVVLSLLCLSRAVFSSEYFSSLTLFNNELHKQGCSSFSEWEEYAADCGKVSLLALYFATSSSRVQLSPHRALASPPPPPSG